MAGLYRGVIRAGRTPAASSSGVTLLDDYIRDLYKREHTVGMYELWRRQP